MAKSTTADGREKYGFFKSVGVVLLTPCSLPLFLVSKNLRESFIARFKETTSGSGTFSTPKRRIAGAVVAVVGAATLTGPLLAIGDSNGPSTPKDPTAEVLGGDCPLNEIQIRLLATKAWEKHPGDAALAGETAMTDLLKATPDYQKCTPEQLKAAGVIIREVIAGSVEAYNALNPNTTVVAPSTTRASGTSRPGANVPGSSVAPTTEVVKPTTTLQKADVDLWCVDEEIMVPPGVTVPDGLPHRFEKGSGCSVKPGEGTHNKVNGTTVNVTGFDPTAVPDLGR